MNAATYTLQPVGRIESALTDLSSAPRQADEHAPPATLIIDPAFAAACANLRAGDEIIVLTWLDRARRIGRIPSGCIAPASRASMARGSWSINSRRSTAPQCSTSSPS